MIFRYTILYVDNVAASLAFFTRAFGLETGFVHESGHYGELSTGDTKLAFSSNALMNRLGKAPTKPKLVKSHYVSMLELSLLEAGIAFNT